MSAAVLAAALGGFAPLPAMYGVPPEGQYLNAPDKVWRIVVPGGWKYGTDGSGETYIVSPDYEPYPAGGVICQASTAALQAPVTQDSANATTRAELARRAAEPHPGIGADAARLAWQSSGVSGPVLRAAYATAERDESGRVAVFAAGFFRTPTVKAEIACSLVLARDAGALASSRLLAPLAKLVKSLEPL
ncbi:MAG: hypothetical protein IT548_15535 [Alphaproteobacteria bacterium]|nr:hypothetical protein [Alphaproteobacteria bacterium]